MTGRPARSVIDRHGRGGERGSVGLFTKKRRQKSLQAGWRGKGGKRVARVFRRQGGFFMGKPWLADNGG
jgi:hypothetical protein